MLCQVGIERLRLAKHRQHALPVTAAAVRDRVAKPGVGRRLTDASAAYKGGVHQLRSGECLGRDPAAVEQPAGQRQPCRGDRTQVAEVNMAVESEELGHAAAVAGESHDGIGK